MAATVTVGLTTMMWVKHSVIPHDHAVYYDRLPKKTAAATAVDPLYSYAPSYA